MNLKQKLIANWRGGAAGAVLTMVAGLSLGRLPLGDGLTHLSYELPFCFRTTEKPTNVVLLVMDRQAHLDFDQDWGKTWDRSFHATLLDYLREDQARLVVFDVVLDEPGTEEANEKLARAITLSGNVVLAAEGEIQQTGLGPEWTIREPLPQFATNASAWGIGGVLEGFRKHHPGTQDYRSLPWAAAEVAGAEVTTNAPQTRRAERWINYYGTSGTILSLSYSNAYAQLPGYFRGKFVFIGGKSAVGVPGDTKDAFRTPWTRWNNEEIPGVEVMATTFLNLWRGDWLKRLDAGETLILLGLGLLFGYGFRLVRARTTLVLAFLGMVGVTVLAAVLFLALQVWFCWTVVVAVQIPCALAFSFVVDVLALSSKAEAPAILVPTPTVDCDSQTVQSAPEVRDHTLVQQIGSGAFGEVWLARNVIGTYHAAKLVYRRTFSTADPYERAFRGIQNFMPISRSHPGFVNILQAGRYDEEGYFYYVMEVADDESSGQNLDPENYSAKSLKAELVKRQTLSMEDCLDLMLRLTDALDCLHQRRFVHRDIKPANIIYVDGIPKLADIDLVTEFKSSGPSVLIGTPGFIPIQGMGTPAGDLYSLGKVLYVTITGKNPDLCPELPTTLPKEDDHSVFLEMNRIICKACDEDLHRRYQSASEMHTDLSLLREKFLGA